MDSVAAEDFALVSARCHYVALGKNNAIETGTVKCQAFNTSVSSVIWKVE